MSIVADQVRKIDSQLDKIRLVPKSVQDGIFTSSQAPAHTDRIAELNSIIKALSTTASSRPLLSPWRVSTLLDQASLTESWDSQITEDQYGICEPERPKEDDATKYEIELEWLLVSKATVQTYGLVMSTLFEHTVPLNDDIWYWDEVLGSYAYTGIYTIQTSPLRLWAWTKDIFNDARGRFTRLQEGTLEVERVSASDIGNGITAQWKQFYELVRESIRQRSVFDLQKRVLSPVALCRAEARRKQAKLKQFRETASTAIGMLVDEVDFNINDDLPFDSLDTAKALESVDDEWKIMVGGAISLMDNLLCNIASLPDGVDNFVPAAIEAFQDSVHQTFVGDTHVRPAEVGERLQFILNELLPDHVKATQKYVAEYGRPSRLVRYWLPAGLFLLSSTTILRIFASRRAEIITWVHDLGSTVRDFWMNWVLEPTKKVIGTIRHDKDSEVAIMSKESLKGDRDSLERMVVDFAVDNPAAAGADGALNDAQISEIRAKVREGDLTPVLRAYEQDLKKPFVGTVRGDLIRSLLIQVQKTKVDVEVAISGIDKLLKSQELVFGLVGLTPGIIVCFAAFRYLAGTFGNRKGVRHGKRAGQTVRVLRNIDRILTLASPTDSDVLSYKDHGLLLCEVHVLRSRARNLFPGEIEREFLEDVNDLCDHHSGLVTQLKVLDRIRWAYAKWLR
ncbi:ATP synthase regulation protein NCA2-domain-containing protein [Bisporella sp. PMI_857]|nr:ATP synthase regulation protein NCA2-domain-containing protein [Bisporella sp. PMI_857]